MHHYVIVIQVLDSVYNVTLPASDLYTPSPCKYLWRAYSKTHFWK